MALHFVRLASSLPHMALCDDRVGPRGVCVRFDRGSGVAAFVCSEGQMLLRFPPTVTRLLSELVVRGSSPLHKPIAPPHLLLWLLQEHGPHGQLHGAGHWFLYGSPVPLESKMVGDRHIFQSVLFMSRLSP